MGITKRYLEEVQAEEEMKAWITEQGSIFMEEGDEEWKLLEEEYLNRGNDSIGPYDDWDYDYGSELKWTKQQTAFITFKNQVDEVIRSLSRKSSDIVLKMNFSFAVTLMESCLGDLLRGVVFSDTDYLINAMKHVPEIKKARFSLLEFHEQDDLVNKVILQTLVTEYSYHHIQRTTSLFHSIMQIPLTDDVTSLIKEMQEIIEVRHDIVHRNGFTTDDVERDIDYDTVKNAIGKIQEFVSAINEYVRLAQAQNLFK